MLSSPNDFYLLALTRIEGVGCITARRLLSHYENPKDIFKASKKELKSLDAIGSILAEKINQFNAFDVVEKEITYAEKNNIEILTILNKNYPPLLKHCVDAPIVLFKKGTFNLQYHNSLSIVGTRNMTAQGSEAVKNLLAEMVPFQPTIISGYAFGVDICAHLAAIDHNLPTIAVLGHGLQTTYPSLHKKYNSKIYENGCFLTEFWSSDIIDRENFVRRNRIAAGLSQATLVIESAIKGGSLITAQMANDYGREVFALPGRITDLYSEGCNYLIKTNQAQLITKAEDIAFMLNWDQDKKQIKKIQPQLFVDLPEKEQKIYDYLKEKKMELLDILSIDLQIPVHQSSVLLLNLELKGLVRPLPGKMYQCIEN